MTRPQASDPSRDGHATRFGMTVLAFGSRRAAGSQLGTTCMSLAAHQSERRARNHSGPPLTLQAADAATWRPGRSGGLSNPKHHSSERRAYGVVGRNAPRSLRDPGSARSRGHGGGLPRPRHAPRTNGCHQGVARRPGRRPSAEGSVRARGPCHLGAGPPQYLHAARRWRGRRTDVPGHGAPGRPDAVRSPQEGAFSARPGLEVATELPFSLPMG